MNGRSDTIHVVCRLAAPLYFISVCSSVDDVDWCPFGPSLRIEVFGTLRHFASRRRPCPSTVRHQSESLVSSGFNVVGFSVVFFEHASSDNVALKIAWRNNLLPPSSNCLFFSMFFFSHGTILPYLLDLLPVLIMGRELAEVPDIYHWISVNVLRWLKV